ncbi:Histone-lysine N-methyltransferase SETMAR, partial [Habropoda laboriosa]
KMTLRKLNDLGYEILPHSLYSPELLPIDYHLLHSSEHYIGNKTFERGRKDLRKLSVLQRQGLRERERNFSGGFALAKGLFQRIKCLNYSWKKFVIYLPIMTSFVHNIIQRRLNYLF